MSATRLRFTAETARRARPALLRVRLDDHFQARGLCLVAALLVTGCNNQSSPPTAESNPAATPAAVGEAPVTALDRESLLAGAGPVDQDAPQEFTETASGLKDRILRKSDGQKPAASDSVTVHYRGWLDNGSEFDSSYARGEAISFPLTGVIAGWTEGMQLVGEGGMIELWIPPQLGYGARGSAGAVPPNATLHFSEDVIEALDCVTHRRDQAYHDYVVNCKRNPIARQVKLSDLQDNARLSRLLLRPATFEGDAQRLHRYILSYRFLTDEIDESQYRSLIAQSEV